MSKAGPEATREMYGYNCLLARRLIEKGVRLKPG